jgi:hypothetical protein
MKSHEALKRAAGEQGTSMIKEIATRLSLAGSTVYKWTEPSESPTDSGARNPVDILKQYIESCLILGRPKEDALAPLDHLDNHFGRIAITLPNLQSKTTSDLQKELLIAMKECGDVLACHNEITAHSRISQKDIAQMEEEVWQATKKLVGYLYVLKGTVK